jgi:ABC-2 type transport system ATP-binding protein
LLQQTNLYEVRKKSLGGYSGGMKQRFGIAQALLGNPRIIIVDEPTAGLDPTERNRFLNLLSEISQNVVVILSTHIVEDVKELCPNMAIINKGEVLFAGSPHEALQTIKGKIWRTIVPKQVAQHLAADYRIISTKFNTGLMEVRILSDEKPANDNLENVEPQLEDIYFCKINKML